MHVVLVYIPPPSFYPSPFSHLTEHPAYRKNWWRKGGRQVGGEGKAS